ncbi:MAG: fibronectin type III domain-containing protein [Chthoniobacteraceae bacterium]
MDQLFSAVRLYSLHVCFCITLLVATFPARAQYGQLDGRFTPPAILKGPDPAIVRAGLESGTGVLIAGDFTTIGGVAKGGLARLDFTGALDQSFGPAGGANGPVHAIIRIGSDKFLIAGDFTSYGGVPRPRIARINSQGTLDTTFAPTVGPDGPVYSLLSTESGYVVGGDFERVGEAPRANLALFTTSGVLSSTLFTTGPNGPVYALAYESIRRHVLVGGDFTMIGESLRSRIAAFSISTGTPTTTWSYSGADGPIYNIVVTPFGFSTRPSVLIGGDFRTIFGHARSNIVAAESPAYNPVGGLDETFRIYADRPVRTTDIFGGRLSLGGDFTVIDGSTRNHYARLKPMTNGFPSRQSYELDLAFEAGEGANGSVHGFSTTPDGITYVFGAYTAIQGSPRPGVARLLSPLGLSLPAAPTKFSATALSEKDAYLEWVPPPSHTRLELERKQAGSSTWKTVSLPSSGTTSIRYDYMDSSLWPGTQYTFRLRAFNLNGPGAYTPELSVMTKAESWNGPGQRLAIPAAAEMTDGSIYQILPLPNGNVMICGSFRNVQGKPRKYIARLLPDYTLDTSFDPGESTDNSIEEMAADQDGRIYIRGTYSLFANDPHKHIVRLRADGSLDPDFVGATLNSTVHSIAVQPHRGLLILGSFSRVDGEERQEFARLHFDGKLDRSFSLNTDSAMSISSFAMAPDGGFFVGGSFEEINGRPLKHLIRVLPDDTIDMAFAPNMTSGPGSMTPLRDGGLYLFMDDETGAYRLNRLTSTGAIDPSFIPPPSLEAPRAIRLQPDGKLLLTTPLQAFGSHVRYGLMRLQANGELDETFDAGAARGESAISSIAYGRDGNILVGGYLPDWAGAPANHFVILKGRTISTPNPPADLHALPASRDEITLNWRAGDQETEYLIERSVSGTGGWEQVAQLPSTFISWTDTHLETDQSYFYRVTARNSAGSAVSDSATSTTFTAFQQWKLDHGMPVGTAGDSLDDDEDGIPAIMEYALGLDPTVQSTEGMPVHQLLNGAIALSYRKFRHDVSYLVEGSEDLTNWTTEGVNQGSGAFPIAWSLMGPAPKKYLRLQITAE